MGAVTPADNNTDVFGFFGKKENENTLAHRMPRVWFQKDTFRITILLVVFGKRHKYTHNQDIETAKFTNFKVVQYQKQSGKFVYEIYVDGTKVFGVINNDPREFENVEVFLSTPWNHPSDCIVRNFIYSNLE